MPFLDGCVYVAGERVVACRSAWKARVRRTEESGGIRVATQAGGLESDKSAEVAPTGESPRALEGKRGGDGRFRARSPGSQTRKFFTLQRRPANLPSRCAPRPAATRRVQALPANALSKSRKCPSSTTPAQRRRAVVGRLCAVVATGGINARYRHLMTVGWRRCARAGASGCTDSTTIKVMARLLVSICGQVARAGWAVPGRG